MRLLMIEDDEKISAFVTRGLTQAGFGVDHAADGESGLKLGLSQRYDVAIIDLMLPKLDGLSVIRELRKQQRNIPVLVLSAKRDVEERVQCLEAGSDDYMVKPFAFSELLARVHALRRRADSAAAEALRLNVGSLTLDFIRRNVEREGQSIELQPREFSLLEFFMRNAGRVVSKTLILEHVWNYHFDPQTNVVDVLVCRLRAKIDKDFTQPMLHTIRGVGYVLKSA